MDEFDSEGYIEDAGMGPRIRPAAKDLLGGIGSQILRSMLVSAPGEIYSEYGFSPAEASVSLACCELAELRFWDEDALVDAATAGSDEEQRLLWGLESREKLARRIALTMRGDDLPSLVSPAEGVLLLRRAGISVFHELLDAVASVTLEPCTDEAQRLFRLLKGIPSRTGTESGDAARAALAPAVSQHQIEDDKRAAHTHRHRLSNRSHPLDAVIAMAEDKSVDRNDYQSVWEALVKLAEDASDLAPLVGYVPNEGVQYRSDKESGGLAYFTKKALAERYRRKARSR